MAGQRNAAEFHKSPLEGIEKLETILREFDRIGVAVSGGVDSMALAVVAHRALASRVTIYHAVSPAVPPEATQRVRTYAVKEGWELHVLNAGEFSDPNYILNPVNRCFFCKSNLYRTIREHTEATIVSGANLDDLSDYRPGLEAAREFGVRHPFVEAGIDKQQVRSIARRLELNDLAELPAAPCLSSRIETGIQIDAGLLDTVHSVERLLTQELNPGTVRCRVRGGGIFVELDEPTLSALSDDQQVQLVRKLRAAIPGISASDTIRFEPYVTGSAFLKE